MSSLDDDEERKQAASGNTIRYPVMPSLVALQQMKNRLHLARVGKKLMKWTALATGREMRRIATDLVLTYGRFKEDVGAAFMALARARYYYPSVNEMVIANFPTKASVQVKTLSRSTAGVKLLILEMVEMKSVSYEHLGIGKGGCAVREAKQAWLDLLRRMMLMLQHRTSFLDVECAHKNATKKKNVLEKVVVPRIIQTIEYIKSELEEIEREEIFRLKRFKQIKTKYSRIKDADNQPKVKEEIPEIVAEVEIEEPEPKPEPHEPEVPEPEVVDEPVYKPCGEPCIELVPKPIQVPDTLEEIEVCCSCLSVYGVDETAPEPFCPVCKKAARVRSKFSKVKLILKPCESAEYKKRLGDLTTHIDEVINLSKQYKMEGIMSSSIDKFIQTCNNTKEKIEENIASTCNSHQKASHSIKPESPTGSQKSVRSAVPDRPTEVPTLKELSATVSKATVGPAELGYFESKYKEVTKVTRLQNLDGTISEEKHVITVKTEIKNPRKPGERYEQENIIGSCTCNNHNIKHNIAKMNIDNAESSYSQCIGHRGDEGLKEMSKSNSPRQTKSELLPRCPAMVEPKLRACISADPENSMNGDICKTCASNISSKVIPLKTANDAKSNALLPTAAVTSTDNAICLSKTHSGCSQKLTPRSTKASSTALKHTDGPQKKVTLDKSTYCMPNCYDRRFNTVSSGDAWRDTSTSTTDLKLCATCTSKTSTGSSKKKVKKNISNSDSCCKIKIIIKPHDVRDDNKKCRDEAVSVTSSVIDALTKLVPCNQNEGKRDWSEIENLCIRCLAKLKVNPMTCTISCQEPNEDALQLDGYCQSCLLKMKKPSHQTSRKCEKCKETFAKAIESNELCKRCVAKLISALPCTKPSEKCLTCQICQGKFESLSNTPSCAICLAKIDGIAPCRTPLGKLTPKASQEESVEEIEKEIICPSFGTLSRQCLYCTSTANVIKSCDCTTSSSNNTAVPYKYSKICLNRSTKKVSSKSVCCGSISERRDASTLTKRCNRFDVRSIRRRHTCDIAEPRPRSGQAKKSHSFHEKDYNYFKKPKQ